MSTANYNSFPSIERLENIYCIITEKIDGTNGLIEIHKAGSGCSPEQCTAFPCSVKDCDKEPIVKFGSRNRYITYQDEKYVYLGDSVWALSVDEKGKEYLLIGPETCDDYSVLGKNRSVIEISTEK